MEKHPIVDFKQEIMNSVKNNDFTIISAEAGTGKSTQVPQFLSEVYGSVIVTEPKIIAAKTLAKRVSEENGTTLGSKIGYMTAYDKCYSKESNILYCTDGLQLVRTIFDEDRTSQNILCIDEIHEWNNNIESLVGWVKHVRDNWRTKVVLMSATMETEKLASFFGRQTAVIEVPGKTFNVDVEERSSYSLISTIKEQIELGKDILVFVPGKKEIRDIITRLEEDEVNATLLPLHSEIEWEDQKKCFLHYKNTKVIVATDIAQTSITIPDLDVVVDTGKRNIPIAVKGVEGVYTVDISQADISQRLGRVGRTKDGKYILCSDVKINEREKYTIPEINRRLLDRTVLQMAAAGLDAEEIEFFHQPDKNKIQDAKEELRILGAFDENNNITDLGKKMVKMPISPKFSRMVVEAEKYNVTGDVIIIASILEHGSLLSKEGRYRRFTNEGESDLLAELDVFKYLSSLKYIDFSELGINKKRFTEVKKHIAKFKETLYGDVDFSSTGDREHIKLACMSGLLSNAYRLYNCDRTLVGRNDSTEFKLDLKSCVKYSNFVLGVPHSFECKNTWYKSTMNIVSLASSVSNNFLLENLPSWLISKTVDASYSSLNDAVKVTTKKYYGELELEENIEYFHEHPLYESLKAKYEEDQRRYVSVFGRRPTSYAKDEVEIAGKKFEICTSFATYRQYICINDEFLFGASLGINEYTLASGDRLYFKCSGKEDWNLESLRKKVYQNMLFREMANVKLKYQYQDITTVQDASKYISWLGGQIIGKDNFGRGDNPIYVYGYLNLKNGKVSLSICEDEKLAAQSTVEALQHLVMKYVDKNYPKEKFSHATSTKERKKLSEAEALVKKEFDDFVREILLDINPEKLNEGIEFIDEYYAELMN